MRLRKESKLWRPKETRLSTLTLLFSPSLSPLDFPYFQLFWIYPRQCRMVQAAEWTSSTSEDVYWWIHSVRSSCWMGKGQQDLVEELQGIVSLQQIRGKCKGITEPLEIFVVTRSPVFLLVDLFCLQKTGNTFDFSEICHVAGVFELVLIAEADLVYHVIEPFDDVEGVDTDPGIGEVLFCNGDKAIAHVAAEVFYLLALRRRERMEISVDSDAGDLVQDIDDGVCVAVRNTAVELIEIPSVATGAPDAGVALEFINADGFGKLSRQAKPYGLENRLDGAL